MGTLKATYLRLPLRTQGNCHPDMARPWVSSDPTQHVYLLALSSHSGIRYTFPSIHSLFIYLSINQSIKNGLGCVFRSPPYMYVYEYRTTYFDDAPPTP